MTTSEIPKRPARVSRDEAKAAKERERLFDTALKSLARASGWKFARGTLFRDETGWFVSAMPALLWERGAVVPFSTKPMGADPIFWRIVGLAENEDQALSFRANGAWVLRAPSEYDYVALSEVDPELLAEAVIHCVTERLATLGPVAPGIQADAIAAMGDRRRNFAALEVCLRIMDQDLEQATALCRDHTPDQNGGYQTGDKTFYDQAYDWMVRARQNNVSLA